MTEGRGAAVSVVRRRTDPCSSFFQRVTSFAADDKGWELRGDCREKERGADAFELSCVSCRLG